MMASYQDAQGEVCRTFIEHSPASSDQAVACFKRGQWQVERADHNDGYRTASSASIEKQGRMTPEQEKQWLKQTMQSM